jgi:uncharacterized membrane protein YfcA
VSWLELLLIPLGFVVGVYGTIVGAGGGFVLVPILLLVYTNEDPVAITSISLGVVFFNAVSGSLAYGRLRRIDYRTGLEFAAAALPGAVAGALLVREVPRGAFDIAFGALLLGVAAYTMWSVGRPAGVRTPLRGRFVTTRTLQGATEGEMFRYSFNVLHGVLFSAVIGFISSLLGIGGGIIQVPVMVSILRFPIHVATATSQFILMFMSGEGSAVHLINGDLDNQNLLRGVLISVGAIPGAQVGARLTRRFAGPSIARLLALGLFVVGGRLLYAGIGG